METDGGTVAALDDIRPLHPKNHLFPGEVVLRPAADAVGGAGVGPDSPIEAEGLIDRHLLDCGFRGPDNHTIRYESPAVAARHGGVQVTSSMR